MSLSTTLRRVLCLSVLLAGCADTVADDEEDRGETAIAALGQPAGAAQVFIVQLRGGHDVDATLDDLAGQHGLGIVHRYKHALHGGAVLAPPAIIAKLKADPRVLQVETDQPLQAIEDVSAQAQSVPTGVRLIGAPLASNWGAGQRVAVLDTGIDLDHPDLAANVDLLNAKDCVKEPSAKGANDRNGHGSHVAGTVAAVDNSIGVRGVGSAIRVVPVKVLNRNGSGSWATVICGIDYVTSKPGVLRVANMSLGGSGTECSGTGCTKSTLQTAIETSVAKGVTYAVAAGNNAADVKTFVPAAYGVVITVSAYRDANGALDASDGWASFTNYGDGVDIAAPGVGIYSTYKDAGYATLSGTSMASPHVAAAAALFLATAPLDSTPLAVRNWLVSNARTAFPGDTDSKHGEPLLNVSGL